MKITSDPPRPERIPTGTRVVTRPGTPGDRWSDEMKKKRQNGSGGFVVDFIETFGANCYEVEHDDGTVANYLPEELEVADEPAKPLLKSGPPPMPFPPLVGEHVAPHLKRYVTALREAGFDAHSVHDGDKDCDHIRIGVSLQDLKPVADRLLAWHRDMNIRANDFLSQNPSGEGVRIVASWYAGDRVPLLWVKGATDTMLPKPDTMEWVLGFAFELSPRSLQDREPRVLLIEKKRGPTEGRWNGLGGKVEPGEAPVEAMAREFNEECGVKTRLSEWTHYLTLEGPPNERYPGGWRVFCFSLLNLDEQADPESKTDETIRWANVARLSNYPIVPNLRWMIPLALDPHLEPVKVFEKAPPLPDHLW